MNVDGVQDLTHEACPRFVRMPGHIAVEVAVDSIDAAGCLVLADAPGTYGAVAPLAADEAAAFVPDRPFDGGWFEAVVVAGRSVQTLARCFHEVQTAHGGAFDEIEALFVDHSQLAAQQGLSLVQRDWPKSGLDHPVGLHDSFH